MWHTQQTRPTAVNSICSAVIRCCYSQKNEGKISTVRPWRDNLEIWVFKPIIGSPVISSMCAALSQMCRKEREMFAFESICVLRVGDMSNLVCVCVYKDFRCENLKVHHWFLFFFSFFFLVFLTDSKFRLSNFTSMVIRRLLVSY